MSGGPARFPRGNPTRSTFHGGQTRRGPGSPLTTHGTGPPGEQDSSNISGREKSFLGKLSSKFSKRYAFCSKCNPDEQNLVMMQDREKPYHEIGRWTACGKINISFRNELCVVLVIFRKLGYHQVMGIRHENIVLYVIFPLY